MIDIKEIENTCLHRIETTMNNEKDPNIQKEIEESGRAICTCMSEHSANPGVIHRVMIAATRAIPKYTVGRQEKKKL